ncbi:MAG TPA: ADOP family duplicated permease [Vicinamibacterales bacterium]
MPTFTRDFRLAARRLGRQPGFAAVAIATLALGLGVNIAIFTIARALTAQELPVREPSALYRLGDDDNCCVNSGLQDTYSLFSTALYEHLRGASAEFQSLAGFQANVTNIGVRRAGASITESVPSQFVSGNYFQTLGVSPHLGRLLEPADDAPGAPLVFVMSHRTWTATFAADPSVVGASFLVAGKPMTLVGVADARFFGETVRPNPAGMWTALGQDHFIRGPGAMANRPESDWLYIIGRLAPGALPEQAEARVTAALQQWLGAQAFVSDEDRQTLGRRRIIVVPAAGGVRTLSQAFEGPVRVLLGMSALVLLIAAANLANLLLARADRGQAAVRVALGAPPGRLVRQSLAEGVLLAAAGGMAALLVAHAATRAIVALAFPNVDFLPIDLAPDAGVLAFAIGLALVTGIVFSSAPALAMSRTDPIDVLRGTGRGGSARGFMPRRTLVVVQVALSMVLLTGAGLLTESLRRLENQTLGFDPDNRVVVHLNPPALAEPPAKTGELYARILDNVGRIPGVAGATYALYSPMEGNNWSSGISIAGYTPPDGRSPNASWNRVGPRYFETTGTRILRGRAFEERDLRPESRVTIVNETLARRFFPDGALGRRLGIGGPAHASDLEIVGIVEDVKYTAATQPARPMIFLPGMQSVPYESTASESVQARSRLARTLILEMRGSAPALQPQVREALAAAHPDFSITRLVALDTQIGGNFRMQRMLARLTTAYGILALALAVLGIYGVTAFGVARRTREIGVRIALGASRARVIRPIVGGAIAQAAAGIVIGGAAAWFAASLVGSFLYDIGARDPFVMSAALAVLIVSAAAAAAVPAWRASGIEAAQALRPD